MRIFRPCFIAGCFYPEAIFRIKSKEKLIFLTFDDGPNPSSTPLLLDILDKHNIKALFFCSGKNAEEHPDLLQLIISKGHITGNHGYSHLNGWTSTVKNYLGDIEKASQLIDSRFLRPPYGRLRLCQYYKLKGKYIILFWDIMPYDFDVTFPWENSFRVLIKKLRPGSVIALHDSPRSSCSLFLNRFIDEAKKRGYQFGLPG